MIVAQAGTVTEVPGLVARYLRERDLPMKGVCWPAMALLDWQDADIEIEPRAARGDDLVGITGAFLGIAETGTLMLLSGVQTPATVSLLPETHIAVVEAGRIVATMEQAWDRLRVERGALPRAVNFISGPSRTADIEQTRDARRARALSRIDYHRWLKSEEVHHDTTGLIPVDQRQGAGERGYPHGGCFQPGDRAGRYGARRWPASRM